MIQKFLLCSWGMLLSLITFSQSSSIQFSHLTINDGLSANKVNCFLKDDFGFLWIGTTEGLNRYDGYSFKVYRHQTTDSLSLPDEDIYRLMQGPDQQIWIETASGIVLFDPATDHFFTNIEWQLKQLGLPAATVTHVLPDRQGHFLFVLNSRDIYRFDPASRQVRLLYSIRETNRQIESIQCDKKKGIWMIQDNGIMEQLDSQTGQPPVEDLCGAGTFWQ